MDGQPHEARWTGDWAVFDFSDTSDIPDFQTHSLQLSAEILDIWSKTRSLAFGTHACIRVDDNHEYPVLKIAHPSDQCRRLIDREYHLMRDLSATGVIAKVATKPLTDENGIFGFRIERLHRIELEELRERAREVEELLKCLHVAGYCHGDWSPSNVMRDQEDCLLLIDLAFAGPLNQSVPGLFPLEIFPMGLFTEAVDNQRLRRWHISSR